MPTSNTGIKHQGYQVQNSEVFFIFIDGEPWIGPYLNMEDAHDALECMLDNGTEEDDVTCYELVSFTAAFSEPAVEYTKKVYPGDKND